MQVQVWEVWCVVGAASSSGPLFAGWRRGGGEVGPGPESWSCPPLRSPPLYIRASNEGYPEVFEDFTITEREVIVIRDRRVG